MTITVFDLISRLNQKMPSLAIFCDAGDPSTVVKSVAPVTEAGPNELSWINPTRKDAAELAQRTRAGALIVSEKSVLPGFRGPVLKTKNPQLTFSLSISEIHEEAKILSTPGIHSTAIVHPETEIHSSISIGPYCVIGKAKLGPNTILESFVQISDGVELGSDCVVRSFTSIGGEGFGFVRDDKNIPHRTPHIGKIIIGNRVSIMQHCNLDRPTLGVTRVGDDSKFDHHCHLAHNCNVGSGTLIAAGLITCGGVRIGDNSFIGAQCTINDAIRIGSDVVLGSASVATKNIPDSETWAGNPARPIKELKAFLAVVRRQIEEQVHS